MGGVAGLIRLGPTVELEVVPKCVSESNPAWREDFFSIAMLTQHGRILPSEALSGKGSSACDISELIAWAIIEQHTRNKNHAIKSYHESEWIDFDLHGELDPESILDPIADGFIQSGLVLDKENGFNQRIKAALGSLEGEVWSLDLRRALRSARSQLGRQRRHFTQRRAPPLPQRFRAWQGEFDLATAALSGLRANYSESGIPILPGYVLNTSYAWEALVRLALRVSHRGVAVEKTSHILGERTSTAEGEGYPIPVRTTPDVTVRDGMGRVLFLVDAKYKAIQPNENSGPGRITSADLYESLAFMESSQSNRLALIYPSSETSDRPAGSLNCFEEVHAGNREVFGITLEVNGLSRPEGFTAFIKNFSEDLSRIML